MLLRGKRYIYLSVRVAPVVDSCDTNALKLVRILLCHALEFFVLVSKQPPKSLERSGQGFNDFISTLLRLTRSARSRAGIFDYIRIRISFTLNRRCAPHASCSNRQDESY